MNKIIPLILILVISSCELIVIGDDKPKPKVIDLTQDTSVGTVYLFKEELQNNNIRGAAQLLGHPNGKRLSGEEQYEHYYDLKRISRVFNDRNISRTISDTLSQELHSIKLELDYLKEFQFTVKKLDSLWYILDYQQLKKN